MMTKLWSKLILEKTYRNKVLIFCSHRQQCAE